MNVDQDVTVGMKMAGGQFVGTVECLKRFVEFRLLPKCAGELYHVHIGDEAQ